MNQILITGEERKKKERKAVDIKTLIMFYAISIILLGILFISGSVYAKVKIDKQVELNTKPTIDITRNDEENTIDINIKHIRGIKTIEYRWNEEESQTIDGKNQKEITESIELIGGTNTLTVAVTEENGQTVVYQKKYTAGNIPKIALEAVSNGVKITISGENKIDYMSYSWDDQEVQTIQVNQKQYEETINVPQGQHTLKVEVVDVNKNVATKTQLIVGDAAPTLSVTAGKKENEEIVFVIDAEDDEEITKVEITFNGAEKQIINVNEKTYHQEIAMQEGENKIIVTAYNKNNLSTTLRRLFNKK